MRGDPVEAARGGQADDLRIVDGQHGRRRLELDAGRWTDGQAPHGDGDRGGAGLGDVAGLAAAAEVLMNSASSTHW